MRQGAATDPAGSLSLALRSMREQLARTSAYSARLEGCVISLPAGLLLKVGSSVGGVAAPALATAPGFATPFPLVAAAFVPDARLQLPPRVWSSQAASEV